VIVVLVFLLYVKGILMNILRLIQLNMTFKNLQFVVWRTMIQNVILKMKLNKI
jgi:hypothetical protein